MRQIQPVLITHLSRAADCRKYVDAVPDRAMIRGVRAR